MAVRGGLPNRLDMFFRSGQEERAAGLVADAALPGVIVGSSLWPATATEQYRIFGRDDGRFHPAEE